MYAGYLRDKQGTAQINYTKDHTSSYQQPNEGCKASFCPRFCIRFISNLYFHSLTCIQKNKITSSQQLKTPSSFVSIQRLCRLTIGWESDGDSIFQSFGSQHFDLEMLKAARINHYNEQLKKKLYTLMCSPRHLKSVHSILHGFETHPKLFHSLGTIPWNLG